MAPPTPAPPDGVRRRLAILRALYALQYAAAGLWIPYLAPFLEASGLSGSVQGTLFALRSLANVVTQPLFGVLADRVGIAPVLRGCAIAGAITFLAMLQTSAPAVLAALVLSMALGASALSSLLDAATISALEGPGGEGAGGPRAFARSRIYGSVGFALAALVFGLALTPGTAGSARMAIVVVAVLHVAVVAVAFTPSLAATRPVRVLRPPSLADAGVMLRSPGVALILGVGALHWVTLAPYHAFFGGHVESHGGGPRIIGLSIALSVAVELAVMMTAPRWLSVVAPRRVLAISSAVGLVRWTLTAVGSPAVIVAAQALHGLSYGAFYLSMVDAIVRRTSPHRRATAQALIASIAMSGGTFLGNVVAGPLYDIDRGRTLFLAAGAFSVLSAAAALAIPPAPERPPLDAPPAPGA